MPTTPHPEEPAEGSHEAVDRQLKKSESKNDAKTAAGDGESSRGQKPERDIEKDYPLPQFVEKLRRLADALEQGKRFDIQIAGERVSVPANAAFIIEHEREDGDEEIEFQIKWSAK